MSLETLREEIKDDESKDQNSSEGNGSNKVMEPEVEAENPENPNESSINDRTHAGAMMAPLNTEAIQDLRANQKRIAQALEDLKGEGAKKETSGEYVKVPLPNEELYEVLEGLKRLWVEGKFDEFDYERVRSAVGKGELPHGDVEYLKKIGSEAS